MSLNTTLPILDTKVVNPIIPARNINSNIINSTDNKTESNINNKTESNINNKTESNINNTNKKESDSIKNIIVGYYLFATIAIILYFVNDGELNKSEYELKIKQLPFDDPQSEYRILNELIKDYIVKTERYNRCIDLSKAGCLQFRLKILDLINEKDNNISKEKKELYVLMFNSYSNPIFRFFKYTLMGYIGVPIILLFSIASGAAFAR